MKHLWIIPFLALTPVSAQEPDDQTAYLFPSVPSEEQKKAALMLAYKINGNSMVGNNRMIDLTQPIPIEAVRVPVAEVRKAMPAAEEPDLNMDDLRKFSRRANYKTDICARHHMRKVMIRGGSSWRCK
jgi:hypothetical protein